MPVAARQSPLVLKAAVPIDLSAAVFRSPARLRAVSRSVGWLPYRAASGCEAATTLAVDVETHHEASLSETHRLANSARY